MTHNMRLREKSFMLIKNGQKTIDLRLLDEKRQFIKRGDEIVYSRSDDGSEKIRVQVLDVHKYKTFEELFSAFDCESLGAEKREDLSYIYDIYSKDEEKRYGVVGIEVRFLPE